MKSFLLTILGFFLLAPKSFAILDANNNGLSDLWEKAQNNGELFSETFSPLADPDSDGWTNAQEASAGTSPFDPNPPDGLIRPEIAHIPAVLGEPDENGVPIVITPEAVTVAWPTLVGKQYTLLFSSDLTEGSWIPIGEPFISTGNEVTYGFEVNDSDKRFWRISVSDVDTDSDGLSNHEEFLAGTNPAMADADGDGWTDSQELIAGTDPRNQDSDGDGIPDPIDTQLLVSALAFPDADGDGIADSDDAAPNDPRGPAPMIVSETASGNPVSNLVKDETVRFMVSVTNPSGPAPTASNLTFFLNGTEETANITAVGSPGASSQSFLLTWTAKTTTDYPTRTLQNLTLRFRDVQMATTWLKLARIDVAEWEGYIAMAPVRQAATNENGMDLQVQSHVNGIRHVNSFGNGWSARDLYYRGPRCITVLNEDSQASIATFQIPPGVKSPLFITRFTASSITNTSTIDAGDFASYPHNSDWYYNNTPWQVRYNWGGMETNVESNTIERKDYGTAWGDAFIEIHWWPQGQMSPLASTTWTHAQPFTDSFQRGVHSVYPVDYSSVPRAVGFSLYSKLPASIIPHLAGSVEVPGLPIHPLAIEKEGILFPVASETYHQILYKVDPAAEVWTAGIKLHLGQTSGQDTTPQTGIGLYDFTSGDPEPISLDADGDLLLSPTQNTVLYQKLTSSGGLPLFLKRTSSAYQPHTLEIRFVSKYETGLETTVAAVNLLPVEVAVDADRDGEITFDGRDKTTAEKPYRFWINNDQDDVEADEPVTVDQNERDLLDSTIKTSRDLEDFSRISISVGIPLDQLQQGKYKVGLKFKNSTITGPAVRVWPNESNAGSRDYLTDGTAAVRQRSKNCIGDTLNGTAFIPASYWSDRPDSKAHLIFEGVKKGQGELVLIVKPETMAEVESASIYLNLLDVREMYQRARIANEAEQIPDPWVDDTPPAQTWSWDPWNWSYSVDPDAENITAVFVHGWRLTYMEFMGWSDSSYKRLWHQGFKGKFYSFRWATYSPSVFTYNDSEYRAWLCGPSLATFVNQLPNPGRRSLFAHSMGNVITGCALRHGMSVQYYGLCNAAMASMAYDPNPVLKINPDTGNEWGYIFAGLAPHKTPDTDPVQAIRDSYGIKDKFNSGTVPRKFNLGLPDDSALNTWVDNNLLFKPDANGHSYYYQDVPQPPNLTYKLFQAPPVGNPREVTSQTEAMAYVTKSLTRTAGADLRTRGSIQDSHDMSGWGAGANHSGFGETHSAQWRWSNQSTHLFWEKLFEELELEE